MTSSENPQSDEVEARNKKKRMDLDTILVEEIGQFGPFQMKLLAIASILVLFKSWSSSEYMFTTGRINTRCFIPGCDSNVTDFTPEWVWSAVPGAGGAPDGCQRYANISALPADGSCPAHLFNSSLLQPCDSYIYENTNTVAYDFDLACEEWRRSFIGTMRVLGMFGALPLTGYISDRWGRRTALAINAINAVWLGSLRYFANSYILFISSLFMETLLSGATYTCANIITMEMLGPKYRVLGSLFTNSFLSIGKIALALIAMALPNWRHLTLAIYGPQLLGIVLVWRLSESVRWSMSKGRYEQVELILKRIAKSNKKRISPETLEALRLSYVEQNKRKQGQTAPKTEWLVVELFRNKDILLRCSICSVCWLAKTFIYSGLALCATIISGNQYINFAAAASVEIPGYLIGFILINRIGRKPVLIGAFWTCAACQAAYIFISKEIYAASLTVFLIGKFTSGILLLASIIYTTELYPTEQRHRLLSVTSFMGSMGAIMSPLVPAFAASTFEEMPYVMFGCFALLAGFLLLLLPETRNAKLLESMNDTKEPKDKVTSVPLLQKK